MHFIQGGSLRIKQAFGEIQEVDDDDDDDNDEDYCHDGDDDDDNVDYDDDDDDVVHLHSAIWLRQRCF